jgi:putative transposase
VAELVERRFGVDYHVDHVGRLLHELGWSAQLPTRHSVERDEVAIQRWVHESWRRVKKTPAAVARRSSSSTKPGS